MTKRLYDGIQHNEVFYCEHMAMVVSVSPYPRMTYGHDQREWIESGKTTVPKYEASAISEQFDAAEYFAWMQSLPVEARQPWMFNMMRDLSRCARSALFSAIYYKAMAAANQPKLPGE